MKFKGLAAAVAALMLAGPAMAVTCTSTASFGNMGPPAARYFGDIFFDVGSFTDCYSFNLSASSDSFGGTVTWDTSANQLDITVNTVSLYRGSSLIGSDSSAAAFAFDNLAAGSYVLAVAGGVTAGSGRFPSPVGYAGGISTIAAAVPEPESYAMLLAGFVGVGAVSLRRKKI